MQVPGLVVFLCAFPVEDGLVVDLDELPFRTVAEVAKKAADKDDDVVTYLVLRFAHARIKM